MREREREREERERESERASQSENVWVVLAAVDESFHHSVITHCPFITQ